jgi:hypothetical protein
MHTNKRIELIVSAQGDMVEARLAGGAFPGRNASERKDLFKSFLSAAATDRGSTAAGLAPCSKLLQVSASFAFFVLRYLRVLMCHGSGRTFCSWLLQTFLDKASDLRLSQYIPTLAYAAGWFARAFSLRVTAAEVDSLTVSQAIEVYLPEDMKVRKSVSQC